MLVTVAVCTWNRAALLDRTLAGFHALRAPAGVTWELVVVDNNGTDDTPAVLAKHATALPLRAVREPRQGHSHARNRAVAEARGDLVLWTDDDVRVPPGWLAEYVAAADRFPAAAFFGGPVRPWFDRPPPAWVTRHLPRVGFAWALVDYGPATRPLTTTEYPCGANLGFRTEVLRRYPFDPSLGRIGGGLGSEDETRVIEQVRAAGGDGVWVGSAAVDHVLPPARLTPRYVAGVHRRVVFNNGYESYAADRSPRWRGAPRWMWKRSLLSSAAARLRAVRKDGRWLDAVLEAAKWGGLIDRFRAEAPP